MRFVLVVVLVALGLLTYTAFAAFASTEEESTQSTLIKQGETALASGDYAQAEAAASKALASDPECLQCNLILGIAMSRRGQREAKSFLLKALALEPENARVNLELGKYYFYEREVRAESRDYLEEVIALAPGSSMAAEAKNIIKELETAEAPKWYRLSASLGWQRDNNVALVTDENYLPDEVSHSDDSRWVGTFEAGLSHKFTNKLEGSLGLFYYQNKHKDLYMYDVQSSTLAGGMSYKASDKLAASATYFFDYAYVAGILYSRSHSLTPTVLYYWSPEAVTQLTYKATLAAYPNSQAYETNSERDGTTHNVSLSQVVPITKSNFLKLAYSFELAGADKDYNAYSDHKVSANVISSLPLVDVLLNAGASYDLRNYEGDNPVEGGTRSDRPLQASLSLSRKFLSYFELEMSYLYVKNNSNLSTYAYKRTVAGINLKARL